MTESRTEIISFLKMKHFINVTQLNKNRLVTLRDNFMNDGVIPDAHTRKKKTEKTALKMTTVVLKYVFVINAKKKHTQQMLPVKTLNLYPQRQYCLLLLLTKFETNALN